MSTKHHHTIGQHAGHTIVSHVNCSRITHVDTCVSPTLTHSRLHPTIRTTLGIRRPASLTAARHRAVVSRVLSSIINLKPLRPLVRSSAIARVVVGNYHSTFFRHNNILCPVRRTFRSSRRVHILVSHVVSPLNHHVSRHDPVIGTHLGANCHIGTIVPPITVSKPVLAVQGFSSHVYSLSRLIKLKSLPL